MTQQLFTWHLARKEIAEARANKGYDDYYFPPIGVLGGIFYFLAFVPGGHSSDMKAADEAGI